MTTRTTAPEAWNPVCHRGRFEMFAFTRKYFQEEHRLLLPTPYVAELHADDGGAFMLHFTSDVSMSNFVREMVPTLLEVHRGEGEDVGGLVAMLQVAWDEARGKANEEAEATIARAARH